MSDILALATQSPLSASGPMANLSLIRHADDVRLSPCEAPEVARETRPAALVVFLVVSQLQKLRKPSIYAGYSPTCERHPPARNLALTKALADQPLQGFSFWCAMGAISRHSHLRRAMAPCHGPEHAGGAGCVCEHTDPSTPRDHAGRPALSET